MRFFDFISRRYLNVLDFCFGIWCWKRGGDLEVEWGFVVLSVFICLGVIICMRR